MSIQETLESVNKNTACALDRIRRMGDDAYMRFDDERFEYQGFSLCISVSQNNTIRVALFSEYDHAAVTRLYALSDLGPFNTFWPQNLLPAVFTVEDIRQCVGETLQFYSHRITELAKFMFS